MNLPTLYPASPRPALKPLTQDQILSLVRRGVIHFPEHAMTASVQSIKRLHRKKRNVNRKGMTYKRFKPVREVVKPARKRGKRMKTGRNRTDQSPTLPQHAPEQAQVGSGQRADQATIPRQAPQ